LTERKARGQRTAPRWSGRLGFAACLLAAVVAVRDARAADPKGKARVDASRFEAPLSNIDSALARLERVYARADASLRAFATQKRLVDARVQYELGEYENAAILLYDIVERPEFKEALDYESTLMLIGDCLVKLGNLNAARDAYRKLIGGRDPELVDEARLRLLEVALQRGRRSEIERAIRETPQTGRTDRMRYGLGKAWMQLSNWREAERLLGEISPTSEYAARAAYFRAAALVAAGDRETAVGIYRGLTEMPVGEDPTSARIRDEAWLAIARLLVEKKDYALALASYQNIGRDSVHYEKALYEMAWAYVNQEQFDKAIQTVDVLLLNAVDPDVEVEANVLRGQLHLMRKEYDEALGSYQSIIDRFAPIRNELQRFAKSPDDVRVYFDWLTRRHEATAELKSPLTLRTLLWLERANDLGRVAEVFDGLAVERQEIKEADQIAGELERLLSDQGRVEVFPDLKEGWARLQVTENQLILLLIEMLDLQKAESLPSLLPGERAEFDEIHGERVRLSASGLQLPSSFEAFNRRQEVALQRFRELAQRHFLVEKGMAELQRQLLAIEKALNDRQFSDSSERFTAEQEQVLRTEIGREKEALQGLHDELAALSREIELETRRLGAGDDASNVEQNLKSELIFAIEREADFHDRVAERLSPELRNRYQGLAAVRLRAAGLFKRIGALLGIMEREVARKTAELLKVVKQEQGLLAGYGGEVETLTSDGDTIASRHGVAFFEAALKRMAQVVLDADVGLLDVVWARKSDQSALLQSLNEDRGRRLKALQESLDSIKRGAGDEAGATATTPTPAGGGAP
jgi:tetratricopeptide (TPR) repeat protein